MGDRSAIIITSALSAAPITLYGHFSGSDNLKAVENVLERTDRIGDPCYLTAQLFYEFSRLGNYNGELSFGIWSGEMVEDENPPVWVNADTGAVSVGCVKCNLPIAADTWREELGLCLDCSDEYFDHGNQDNE